MKGAAKKQGAQTAAPKTTRKANRKAAPTLAQRAEAIITADERYDVDTRKAARLALSNFEFRQRETGMFSPKEVAESERELRDLITRAEAGERVTESGAGAECDAVARAVIDLLDMPMLPDFLLSGILFVLQFTTEVTGAEMWLQVEGDNAEPHLSADVLARTCQHHQALVIEIERKKDLAALIAAVLNHADTPAQLHNDLQDAIGSLPGFDRAHRSPEYIRALLAASRTDEGE